MSDRERFKLLIPLSNDGQSVTSAVMFVPRPMTDAEWEQFHATLAVMRPGLVFDVPAAETLKED